MVDLKDRGRITLRVTEIFQSIQGESSYAGWPCAFIRLTGCPLRCTYCDTAYAFEGGETYTIDGILSLIDPFKCRLVQVTGGEPLAQKGTIPLLQVLADRGYKVLLETGGSEDIRPVDPRVVIIYDIKTPGSGEVERNRWENLAHLKNEDEIKCVIGSRKDYEWSRDLIRDKDLEDRHIVHFSPVFGAVTPRELTGWILEDGLRVRLNLQLHKFIWDPETRGV
ncbi:MAG: 7-carboxy-7-deazaguanine synthase QueE [Candidatus Eisenbacteria bacterium]|uniref:7-carboxy-7-deazaguanine synthase n=1 Tax=Eiseniibacteriota bacterium TaxID=2212470 RepID=A0A948RWI6_UNCEI|nr:7-carboxy-7-deazaguanine synthase QueE [Candidatus Eisenbacteria bacterium]MBU1947454.1 7-carboxy-7-deazaguanine synthase QueE [Candidatus Eisenbacteria bacterium]MBU2690853.1 7-carboxy-7-deazaguanine synthase QueE [Candidatus Eisenbacteria bacterium]